MFRRLSSRLRNAADATATAALLELQLDLKSTVSLEPNHADRRLAAPDRLADLAGVQQLVQSTADPPGGTAKARPPFGARVGALSTAQHPAARLGRSSGSDDSR